MTACDLRQISLKEVQENNGQNGIVWTVVRNKVYDITEFVKRHPGGQVIRIAGGRDATTLYESYHPGDKQTSVDAVLDRLPVLGVLTSDDAAPATDDRFFKTVRARVEELLRSQGVSRHYYDAVATAEVVFTVIAYLLATYWSSVHGSYVGTVLLGFCTARLGFCMHSGNHAAKFPDARRNSWTGCLMCLVGSSCLVWSHEHQVAHHCDPNEVGKDNDCSIGDPFMRLHPDVKPHWSQRWQHVTTFILMTGGFFKWYVGDFQCFFDKRVGSVEFHPTRADWIHLWTFKGLWMLVHVLIPLWLHGPGRTVAMLVLFMGLGAHYLENVFIVNHIQDGLSQPPKDAHWATRQVLTTSNWSTGSVFWNWFSGGLNHQIEHHMFPSMSTYLYPRIAPVVKQTCEEFGIQYTEYPSFFSAWIAMARYLKKLGQPA